MNVSSHYCSPNACKLQIPHHTCDTRFLENRLYKGQQTATTLHEAQQRVSAGASRLKISLSGHY